MVFTIGRSTYGRDPQRVPPVWHPHDSNLDLARAARALVTQHARIGILVSSNTFRHPALLAKQAVTVDHLSGGRLELGIGAGWFVDEHEVFGIDFPDAPELVARFREAVNLIDQLLRQDVTTFD